MYNFDVPHSSLISHGPTNLNPHGCGFRLVGLIYTLFDKLGHFGDINYFRICGSLSHPAFIWPLRFAQDLICIRKVRTNFAAISIGIIYWNYLHYLKLWIIIQMLNIYIKLIYINIFLAEKLINICRWTYFSRNYSAFFLLTVPSCKNILKSLLKLRPFM